MEVRRQIWYIYCIKSDFLRCDECGIRYLYKGSNFINLPDELRGLPILDSDIDIFLKFGLACNECNGPIVVHHYESYKN